MKRSEWMIGVMMGMATGWLLPGIAAAQVASFERGSGLKPGEKRNERTLTVAELRVCIDIKSAASSLAESIHHKEMSTDVAQSRYRALDYRLDVAKQTLDDTDQGEIDDYNALVREQGRAVDEYNALAEQLNAMLDEHDAKVKQFNADCIGYYYEADLTKAYSLRERELAAKQDQN